MSYKFKIGEPVRLKNRPYRVVARLSEGDAYGPRYRIRNEEVEDDERIVVERDLRNHAPTAAAARAVVDSVINTKGVIRADSRSAATTA